MTTSNTGIKLFIFNILFNQLVLLPNTAGLTYKQVIFPIYLVLQFSSITLFISGFFSFSISRLSPTALNF